MPSNFLVRSASARSPRAATSAMMARTAVSTSAAVSRLVARKARKRSAKSNARVSRRIGMPLHRAAVPEKGGSTVEAGRPIRGRRAGCGDSLEIGQLDLQAFDLNPQRRAARERECHDTGRRIGFGEFDGKEIEHLVLAGRIHVLALA